MSASKVVKIPDYICCKWLGSGAFFEVYKVEHNSGDWFDVVKVLRPESDFIALKASFGNAAHGYDWALRRFHEEIKNFRGCNHEHIIRYFSCGKTSDDRPYMLLEHCSRGSLAAELGSNMSGFIGSATGIEDLFELCRSILSALDYIHNRGLFHRNIKTANVLKCDEGLWKLSDFGLARRDQYFHAACSFGGVDNAYYVAPELQKPGSRGDERSDLYAVGVVLYRYLCGKLPVFGCGKLHEDYSEIPEGLSEYVHRLLSPLPEDRFSSAGEALKVLGEVLYGSVSEKIYDLISLPDPDKKPPAVIVKPSPPVPPGWCHIESGKFWMGSPVSEARRDKNEGPLREVIISRDFLLKSAPVTQCEWFELMGTKPWAFKNAGFVAPVEKVSWYDAVYYCNVLSRRQNLEECYAFEGIRGKAGEDLTIGIVTFKGLDCPGYRLPTEAEWEYAARAGTVENYYFYDLKEIGWYWENSGKRVHPVGLKKANSWGLFDMLGNIREWCWDWYGDYSAESQKDPLGSWVGSCRVYRGGSWCCSVRWCRSASRDGDRPILRSSIVGFRPARTL